MKVNGVIKNIGGSIIMQGVNILSNLVLPPLLIQTYGSQLNGLVSTITQIISYISLVGAGLSISTTQALYKPLGEHDEKTVSGMMLATGKMFNRIGGIFSCIAIIVAFIYPLTVQCDLKYYYTVLLVLIMSISGAMEFFIAGKYRSFLYANRKTYVFALIQSVCLLGSTVLAILSMKLSWSILATQFTISAVYVLRAILLYIYVRKKYVYLSVVKSEPIWECVKNRNNAMYHQLIGLLVTGSQSIILSIFVSLEVASIYAVYNVVFSGLQSICVQISNAVVPYLGRRYAQGQREEVVKEFDTFEFLFQAFITVIFATAFVMINSFVPLYTRNADLNYQDAILVVFFLIRGYASVIRLPAQGMITAAGFFAETKRAATIEAIICITCELLTVKFWGIYGVMFGNTLALIWRGFEMVLFSNKHIVKQSSFQSIFRIIRGGLCILFTYIVCLVWVKNELITGYGIWVVYATMTFFVATGIVVGINFLVERKKIFSFIKR